MWRFHLMASTFLRDADGGAGGGGDAAAAAAAEAARVAAAEAARLAAAGAGGGGTTEAEAKLLKEVMKSKTTITELQAQLKKFDGIDLVKVQELITAQAAAEAAKKLAEEEALKKAGDFEALKRRMADEHDKKVKELTDAIAAKDKDISNVGQQIVELTIGASFANSKFITDNVVMSPSKARALYGSHFEIDNGKVVAYDKPRGQTDRTPLVDARGQSLDFETAIKSIVEADPDKDTLLRTQRKSGAGVGNQGGRGTEGAGNNPPPVSPISKIANALNAGGLKPKR